MKNNEFINYVVLIVISIAVFLKIECNSLFCYDTFMAPYYGLIVRTILIVGLLIIFNIILHKIHSNDSNWLKMGIYGTLSTILIWMLYKYPLIQEYASRQGWTFFFEHRVSEVVYFELIQLPIIAFSIALIFKIRKQTKKNK